MADISKITLPDGSSYDIKDSVARESIVSSATVSETGLLSFKNGDDVTLFSVQLPLYSGGNV